MKKRHLTGNNQVILKIGKYENKAKFKKIMIQNINII